MRLTHWQTATCIVLSCAASGRAIGAPSPLARTNETFAVSITVDAGKVIGPLKPIWRFFGADEPNYATMKDGRKLLGELGQLRRQEVYFRTHNLLTSGDGTPALKWGSTGAYREDPQGKPVYDWGILDSIFDSYILSGVRPYVEIGFMPKDLSIKPDPYQHRWTPAAKYDEIYTGWAYPPRDYGKWQELVFEWANHAVKRYGKEEVEQWFWEVWNEPNIGYWRGSREEFLRLHDQAIAGVRRALPSARVGGPDVAGGPGGKFLEQFIEHCLRGTNAATGTVGTPLDFVAFHAKGSPRFIDGHVRMGIANQLRDIDAAFAVIARYPELEAKPVVIGESDPDGCAACQGPQLGYRNTTMYSSYTAASFARKHELADRHRVNLEGALTWAFEFEGQPWFAGFRVLASNGVDLPVLSVFRMFARMRGDRVEVHSSGTVDLDTILANGVRERADVSGMASLGENELAVMLWHYHDDDVPGPEAVVDLSLCQIPWSERDVSVTEYRIDSEHSNAYEAWKRMGSPPQPTAEEYGQLQEAGRLKQVAGARAVRVKNGSLVVPVKLPRQAVVLLVFAPAKDLP